MGHQEVRLRSKIQQWFRRLLAQSPHRIWTLMAPYWPPVWRYLTPWCQRGLQQVQLPSALPSANGWLRTSDSFNYPLNVAHSLCDIRNTRCESGFCHYFGEKLGQISLVVRK